MIESRTYRFRVFLLALLLVLPCAAGTEILEKHVRYLADPESAGRLTGSPGEARAVAYIVDALKEIGARPLPGRTAFDLPFEFTAGMNDAGSSFSIQSGSRKSRSWSGTESVQALSFSDNGEFGGEVVFAGYGLSIPETDEGYEYDSYHGLDVTDKIVLVLRYFPEDVEQEVRDVMSRYAGLRYKAMHARELGARAMILVTGPRSPNAGETIPMSFDTALSGSGILAASINGDLAKRIFKAAGKKLEQVQERLDSGNPHVTGFAIPELTVGLDIKVDRERKIGHSVAGYFPADDSMSGATPDEFIILGAHLDHLGHGHHGNSLAKKEEAGQIHHGADDNASGVAAVIEAGRTLSERSLKRPVVLALWSGEELGLLGSSQFIKDELLPVDRIAAYLNLDMVGRMRDNRLSLQSVGSSSVWPRLIEQSNVMSGFDLRTQDDPYLPTDSTTFYQAGIPALHIFTGSHEDYHRPTDTIDRVNFADLERITTFTSNFTAKVAGLAERPDYLEVTPTYDNKGDRDSLRAFTGTIPDYTVEVDGLRLSGVVGGGPADEAGLREGDVIVSFGGRKIANIYDYTYALDAAKIDVPVQVEVQRDGKLIEVTLTPTSRK